jgi:hypothetical protein
METGRFDKTSNFMVASFPSEKLKRVIALLQENHNASVSLLPHQLEMIMDEVEPDKGIEPITDTVKMEVAEKIQVRKTENETASSETNIESKARILRLRLSLKAKAVKVKLKLAA